MVDVVRERLARQHLTGKPLAGPVEVVRALGAVQAQDYAGAKWAIGMRARGATDAAIEAAVADGRILRTHVLRPTWHFVLPEDIRWMLALTGPRIAQAMSSYNRKLGLTPAVFRRANAIIARALADGSHLLRTELAASLRGTLGPLPGNRVAHIMMMAELDAVVCSGRRRGTQPTYALLDHRAPSQAAVDRDEALRRLATRYFDTRGPATIHDFSWWSGLPVGDARRAVEILGPALSSVEMGGRTLWTSRVRRTAAVPPGVAHLLPNYDEYFIGFRDRSSIGQRAGIGAVTGGNALINHVVTIGGQIVGGWKREQRGDAIVVSMKLADRLSRAERAQVETARARFEKFVGGPVRLEERR